MADRFVGAVASQFQAAADQPDRTRSFINEEQSVPAAQVGEALAGYVLARWSWLAGSGVLTELAVQPLALALYNLDQGRLVDVGRDHGGEGCVAFDREADALAILADLNVDVQVSDVYDLCGWGHDP